MAPSLPSPSLWGGAARGCWGAAGALVLVQGFAPLSVPAVGTVPRAGALCGDKDPIDGGQTAESDIWGFLVIFFFSWLGRAPGAGVEMPRAPLHRLPAAHKPCGEDAPGRKGERGGGGFGGSPSPKEGCAAVGRDDCTPKIALDREGASGAVGSHVPRAGMGHPLGVPPQPHKSPFVQLPPIRPGKAPTWLRAAQSLFLTSH